MTLHDIKTILEAAVLGGEELLDREVASACGSDLMSDVLAYVKEQAVLLTGLVNPQTVRTAEMMDMVCIVFVRGKAPDTATVKLAHERSIALLSTQYTMFEACGLLYEHGLRADNEGNTGV